jgi:Multicopper oxidase
VTNFLQEIKDIFEVGLQMPPPNGGRPLPTDQFSRWAIGRVPLWLNFSDPTIQNLDNTTFNSDYVVIPQNAPKDAWIYLIILSNDTDIPDPTRRFVPAAHPVSETKSLIYDVFAYSTDSLPQIHLHGHDFALLQQSNENWNGSNFKPNYNNPPRRDVVLLPIRGFVVIAFKADNPGAWLLHCHIAWHASSGLALQILERQEEANRVFTPDKLKRVDKGCTEWRDWFKNKENYWNPSGGVAAFQDDSGI